MCPSCFPYTDVYVEDPPPRRKKKVRRRTIVVQQPAAQQQMFIPMIPFQAPAAQGQYYAQPQPPQPAVLPAPAAQPQYYNYPQPGPPPAPANAPPLGYAPVTVPMGVDLTGREALARDIVSAHGNRTYEAQSFAPADPDPHRMYWCRELDHTWTHRNRLTIESGDIGDHTWYISPTDNSFYAALKEKVPS